VIPSAVTDHERGAALVEALAAIALLAVVVSGAHPLHRAAERARERAASTHVALVASAGAVERLRAAAPPSIDDHRAEQGGADLVVIPSPHALGWRPAVCDGGTHLDRVRSTAVPVRAGSVPSGPTVSIDALVPVERPAVLRLRLHGAPSASGLGVTVLRADGSTEHLQADPDGCVAIPTSDGPIRVLDDAEREAPPALDLVVAGARSTTARIRVGTIGDLVVQVETADGAELPHEVVGGRLAWWLVEESAGRTAEPGLPLAVIAGTRAFVIGACDDPRAGGTSAVAEVVAGELTTSVVTLPTVEVAAPHADTGRRLVAQRDRPCPGTGSRPILRWVLPGGAFRAAVPDGRWQVRIESPDGRTLLGPVTVHLSGADTVGPTW